MKRERFELSSGAVMRQPRLSTLSKKLDSLHREREAIDAQILACEQAIRRQLDMHERQVVHKEGVWFVVGVEVKEEETVDPTLARSLLPARTLRKLLKKTHKVRVRVHQVPEARAKTLKAQQALSSTSN